MANIPLFRGVADRTGCSAPSPMPSHSGRGAAKAWRIFPSLEGCPTGRGVPWQHRESTKVLRDATPSGRGNLAPSPMPSHQWERGGQSMANIPLFRGVSDRTGCSLSAWKAPTPSGRVPPPPSMRGNFAPSRHTLSPWERPKHGEYSPLKRGADDRTGCSLLYLVGLLITPSGMPAISPRRGISLPHPCPLGQSISEYSPL